MSSGEPESSGRESGPEQTQQGAAQSQAAVETEPAASGERPTDESAPPADETAEQATEEEAEGEEEEEPRLNLDVDIQTVGPCRKRIKVTIPRTDIDRQLDRELTDLVQHAMVPGFRPGHAPRRLIERKYRKEVGETVKRKLVAKSLEQLGEEQEIRLLSEPDLDLDKIDLPEQGPLVYELHVEVPPEFELPDYRGLRIKRPVKEFGEEDVNRQIEIILRDYAQLVPKSGPVQEGDYLIADMAFCDGDEVLNAVEELPIQVQPTVRFEDATVEGFDRRVLGANIGDRLTMPVQVSPEVPRASLRGRTIELELTIKDLKRLRLPELNEDFLRLIGYDSEEQLRDAVYSLLRRRLEVEQQRAARQQLVDQLLAAVPIELPEGLVRRQTQAVLRRRVLELEQAGYSDEEIRRYRVELMQRSYSETERFLREHFVLAKIAEAEELEVTDEDLEREIETIAMRNNESPRRVRARLQREGTLGLLEGRLLEQMAVDRALEYAEYEDVPLEERPELAEEAVEVSATPEAEPEPESEPDQEGS